MSNTDKTCGKKARERKAYTRYFRAAFLRIFYLGCRYLGRYKEIFAWYYGRN